MKQNPRLIQFFFFALMLMIFAVSTLVASIKDISFPGVILAKSEGFLTDLKFYFIGGEKLRNKIELIEIDNLTLEQFSEYGRWPWQRDPQAFLIYSILQFKPKLLVLDIIYAESETVRMPPELEEDLYKIGRSDLVKKFSPEAKLLKTLHHYREKIILTAAAGSLCLPSVHGSFFCENKPDFAENDKLNFQSIEKWALNEKIESAPQQSLLPYIENPILNLTEYNEVAKNFGFSVSQSGLDGVFRNIFLRFKFNNKIFPSLALSAVTNFDSSFVKPAENKIQLNFRSNIKSEHLISAADILIAQQDSEQGRLLKEKLTVKLKDKIVVFGVSATAAGDNHATPIGILSGPEIVVTAIDNLLSGDHLKEPSKLLSLGFLLFLSVLFFGVQIYKNRIQSRYIIPFFIFSALIVLFVDLLLFSQQVNIPSVWVYLFIAGYSFLIIYEKYLVTEMQRNFIKSAFSKYISPDFVNELISNPEKLKIGGIKKELTVMFSDIRSFTTFSEKMDAKMLGEFLSEYFDEMTNIVFASRGTLDKYIGDAVMAFWGDPLEVTDHAYSACVSAKKMMKILQQKHAYYLEKYGVDLQIGIGINTGVVSVGNMGSSKSLGYTVIGDAVNLTSRLEGATKNYGISILTTEATLAQIVASGKELPSHRYLDSLQVKGKNRAVKIAQVFEDDIPEEIISSFNEARSDYLQQHWNEAILKFEKCNLLFQAYCGISDSVCALFIERCKAWQTEPPPANWEGSWKLDSK